MNKKQKKREGKVGNGGRYMGYGGGGQDGAQSDSGVAANHSGRMTNTLRPINADAREPPAQPHFHSHYHQLPSGNT